MSAAKDIHMEPERDDVDRIVDALIAEPGQSEHFKSLIRSKMADPAAVVTPFRMTRRVASAEDIDDMWDNVPV